MRTVMCELYAYSSLSRDISCTVDTQQPNLLTAEQHHVAKTAQCYQSVCSRSSFYLLMNTLLSMIKCQLLSILRELRCIRPIPRP